MTCGGPVVGSMGAKNVIYYRCQRARNSKLIPATCKERNIRSDDLDPAVWQIVSDAIRDPDVIIHEILQLTEKGDGSLATEMKRLEREIGELDRSRAA